jgi:hypothetical protein
MMPPQNPLDGVRQLPNNEPEHGQVLSTVQALVSVERGQIVERLCFRY